MNLNELVELFKSVSPSEKYYDEMQHAATMLREQQAEIEALKRGNEATALLNYNKGHEDGRKLAITPQTKPLQFPTMLRKMWSGSEVQEWLNEQATGVK